MSYLHTIKEKRSDAQRASDVDSLISQIVERLGALPPKDASDIVNRLEVFTKTLAGALKSNDPKGVFEELAKQQKELSIYSVKSARETAQQQTEILLALTDAVKKLADKPDVTIPKTDLTPLESAIRELKDDGGTDLDCYRAHDILESGDRQYIGFVSPSGDWYIVENDTKKNSLRYVFGSGNYAEAVKKAPSYQYRILSEAVHEV